MRKVVDTNILKSDELRDYLSDPANVAVVPDYVVMETLAGGDPKSICEQFQILAEHPQQVTFLKTTHAVAGLRARRRSRGLQRRLLDKRQSENFAHFYKMLELARDGDAVAKRQLAEKCDDAVAHIKTLKDAQETYAANLAEHAKKYTEAELEILRKGEITEELFAKITGEVLGLARELFLAHPYFDRLPPLLKLSNAFLFRYSVAGYIVALRCLKEGGHKTGISAKNIASQITDATIATYATYFDGFLSADKRGQQIYDSASDLLKYYHVNMRRFEEERAKGEPAKAVADFVSNE